MATVERRKEWPYFSPHAVLVETERKNHELVRPRARLARCHEENDVFVVRTPAARYRLSGVGFAAGP